MKLKSKCLNRPIVRAVAGLLLWSAQLNAMGADAKMPIVKVGDTAVKVEVASTDQEVAQGLMYRTSLANDCGMIFLFRPAKPEKFWMYHCKISLDMLFIKDGKIIKICENVPPCKATDERECPTYPEGDPIVVSEVLEVSAGFCKQHHIKEGDPITFDIP